MELSAIILAAGKGTRMKSELPKCAHTIIDKPMVEYVVDTLKELKIKKIVTVVGYNKEVLMDCLQDSVEYAIQEEQLGTAHAVMQAREKIEGMDGITIIAIGDMPFIKKDTLYSLIINHMQEGAKLTVLSVDHPQPYGYGRIVRDNNNQVVGIVEERDCTKEQSMIREINASVYAVETELLFDALDEIENNNSQKEYYLTDLVKIFNNKGLRVCGYKANDYQELSGINTQNQLADMEEEYQRKIIDKHLFNGVSIHNRSTVVIGKNVKIEAGASIMSNVVITGKSEIEKNAKIGPMSIIKDSIVRTGANIAYSIVENSIINEKEVVLPFSNIKNKKD
ncbi:MAG: sugar phosphate nucleotidyltransferase [Bacilli bacterium]